MYIAFIGDYAPGGVISGSCSILVTIAGVKIPFVIAGSLL